MKNILSVIYSSFRRFFARLGATSVHARVLTLIVICALTAAGFWYGTRQSDKTFDNEYAAYADIAAQADNAAYVPGAQSNPVRVALDQVLTGVLDQSVATPQRLSLATKGLDILKESESQIDTISSTTDKADTLIAKMQVDTLDNAASSDKAHAIVALAKNRSSIVSDIRAYSYRTDYEISQIFNRIIADKGALTSAYIIELNNEIPAVETEFNKRSDLYTQLQNTAQQIENAYYGPNGRPSSGGQ